MSGRIELDGQDITRLRGRALLAVRRRIQMVFQDPSASLNPRLTVAQTLEEVLRVHHLAGAAPERRQRVAKLSPWSACGPGSRTAIPTSCRAGSASGSASPRALAVEPEVVVLDEPVSALDVSVQSEVMNLLARLRDDPGSASSSSPTTWGWCATSPTVSP